MHQPVAGIETEYGLLISGRTPHEQVEDAAQFVRCCPLKGFLGWDYRFESPRNDLRGFVLDHLAIDPIDRQFDSGRTALPDQDLKSDRVLANGGRFYNDHGHPEYATPECKSIFLLADHDAAGMEVLQATAEAYTSETDRAVSVFKNNTDYHGASYGAHES